MRFKDKRYLDKSDTGRTRIITKFLLLPLSIKNETRWLEKVKYRERVGEYSKEFKIFKWIPEEFLD